MSHIVAIPFIGIFRLYNVSTERFVASVCYIYTRPVYSWKEKSDYNLLKPHANRGLNDCSLVVPCYLYAREVTRLINA